MSLSTPCGTDSSNFEPVVFGESSRGTRRARRDVAIALAGRDGRSPAGRSRSRTTTWTNDLLPTRIPDPDAVRFRALVVVAGTPAGRLKRSRLGVHGRTIAHRVSSASRSITTSWAARPGSVPHPSRRPTTHTPWGSGGMGTDNWPVEFLYISHRLTREIVQQHEGAGRRADFAVSIPTPLGNISGARQLPDYNNPYDLARRATSAVVHLTGAPRHDNDRGVPTDHPRLRLLRISRPGRTVRCCCPFRRPDDR